MLGIAPVVLGCPTRGTLQLQRLKPSDLQPCSTQQHAQMRVACKRDKWRPSAQLCANSIYEKSVNASAGQARATKAPATRQQHGAWPSGERRETIAIRACNITLESYGPGKGRKERARWNVWLERSSRGRRFVKRRLFFGVFQARKAEAPHF